MGRGHRGAYAAWAAAVWSALFGLAHIYWIMGGRVGLGDNQAADAAFDRAWFLWFNIATAAACLVAVVLALATVQGWGRTVPDMFLRFGLWAATALLLGRGVLGISQSLIGERTEAEQVTPMLVLYDFWFVLGGALFAILAVKYHRPRVH